MDKTTRTDMAGWHEVSSIQQLIEKLEETAEAMHDAWLNDPHDLTNFSMYSDEVLCVARKLRQLADAEKTATAVPALPSDWVQYEKYQLRHADGTPLKGRSYFVLRLDSDDPNEARRVEAAMAAYRGGNTENGR